MSFTVLESILRPLSYWYNQEGIEEVPEGTGRLMFKEVYGLV